MTTFEEKKRRLLQFNGAMVAPFTPFDDKGYIFIKTFVDVSQIPKYLKYFLDNKVDGLYICGTTGEGYSLTNDEKISIVKAWRQAIDEQKADHLLAVVNVSSTCLKESLLLSKEVESLGFDAIAVLPPIYYKPTTIGEWIDYMKAFARSAPTIPLYYYHNARRVGEFSFDFIQAVAEGIKQIPQFSALKFADNDFLRYTLLVKQFGKELKFFMSSEEILLSALAGVDSRAGNCALFNFRTVVDSYKKMVSFVDQNDLDSARKEQNIIIDECIKHKTSGNFFVSAKTQFNAEVNHLGFNVGLPRPPLCFEYMW